jgi:hypothetical protein
MNISTLYETEAAVVLLAVQLRDLNVLRAVCRWRGWEFRTGQKTYRWFGWWLGPGPPPAELGRCAHAIGIPGCLYEIGLIDRGDHWLPVWDRGATGGLEAALGPNGRRLWRSYGIEKVRREARQRGHTVTTLTDPHGTLRVRVADLSTQRSAHVRMASDGATSLWAIGPGAWETFAYLADALGHAAGPVPPDGETAHAPAPR